MTDNTIFADVVNGVIFHGGQKVRPEDLDLLGEKSNFLGLVGHDVFFRIAV